MIKKQILYSIIPFLLICSLVCYIAWNCLEPKSVPINQKTPSTTKEDLSNSISEQPTPEPSTNNSFTIQLSFVGDCLCATNENTSYVNCFNEVADKKDPSYFLEKISDLFQADDFTMADCENVFTDRTDLKVRDKGQYANPSIEAYWFKSAAKNAQILSVGGIDGVSISNNHINDYGSEGYTDTKTALDNANVKWGEEGTPIYFTKNGYKLAIICASMYSSYAVDAIKQSIMNASEETDYQIVYFHGGEEAIHTPESWKVDACHDLVDAGADLIMGDHPHVLQPMETYNGVTIIYSLGNFIFGGNRHPENRTIIYQHTLTITEGQLESQSGTIIPCYVYTGDTNNWQPDIITNKSHKKKVLKFMKGKTNSPY